ncbi:hypothetical protein [Gemmobacter serpentinus]|uniref:hypothetical protein n=1 Tax=Gemmobacter serpentinus TaxID=2652247 RepID=UPI00124DB8B6|nr:hypothetical protein [Gemmobacter serpentinus]
MQTLSKKALALAAVLTLAGLPALAQPVVVEEVEQPVAVATAPASSGGAIAVPLLGLLVLAAALAK